MPRDISDLLCDALMPHAEQRAHLITSLIASHDAEVAVSPAELESAWTLEIEKRDAELESAPGVAIPAEAVFVEAVRVLEEVRDLANPLE